ncbi:unnamed protein product [Albugo candida]|uniref:SKP1 component POZ domain-containing protein n=1 Tax=Albugo candida TaxID=65357 RepID=A0A024G2G8_9STRA|nr:unnamed protein product [Albugo candida]|eukprot:CCI40945.1 unnamed protein product [Albugo candida]
MSKIGASKSFMERYDGHENEMLPFGSEGHAKSGAFQFILECMEGREVQVAHEEAMMSPTLWMLMQTFEKEIVENALHEHRVPMLDVPSHSAELALYYCSCLYQAQIEGHDDALLLWKQEFYGLDSKTLCDLAKIASQLEIQPLIDDTCRAITQIMSTTGASDKIRQEFELDNLTTETDQLFGLDIAGVDSQLEQVDQPSIDDIRVVNSNEHRREEEKKKRKNRAKTSYVQSTDSINASTSDTSDAVNHSLKDVKKMELARQDPNVIFEESKFEDEEDEGVAQQIELFRQALESAHLEFKQCIQRDKPKPRLNFVPGKVFTKHSDIHS